MPIVLIFVFLIAGIIGSAGNSGSTGPANDSDVIVRSPTGGLIRSGSDEVRNDSTNQITIGDNSTGVTPSVSPSSAPAPTPAITQPTVSPSEATPILQPVLNTLAARDIDTNRASLRGSVTYPGQTYQGKGYFIYGTREQEVENQSPLTSQQVISNYLSRSGEYSSIIYNLDDDTRYYYRICFEDSVVRCGNTLSFTTVESINRYQPYRKPSVSTYQAKNINAENATIEAYYNLNDAEVVQGFFVYGLSQSAVQAVPNDYDDYSDVRERGDDLQKISVGRRLDDTATLSREIDDLEKDSKYYYSFCIAYDDDEAAGITCSYPYSFTTKSRQRDYPVIGFVEATVSGVNAELRATINMRDFLDGYAFAVYGSNRSSVEAVENRTQYNQVYQSGASLQKVTLDNDFDGQGTVQTVVRDLTSGFQYYRFCVEYERENDYGSDTFVLECSDTRSFRIQ